MTQTDYVGLSYFQEYCKEFDEHYVVVGVFATVMLLDKELGEGHGKATFGMDLVLRLCLQKGTKCAKFLKYSLILSVYTYK